MSCLLWAGMASAAFVAGWWVGALSRAVELGRAQGVVRAGRFRLGFWGLIGK